MASFIKINACAAHNMLAHYVTDRRLLRNKHIPFSSELRLCVLFRLAMTPPKGKTFTDLSLPDKSDNLELGKSSSPLLEQLASDALNMVKAGKYDEAILLTTSATIKMVEIRAASWERKANITQELHSALMIMQLDSHNVNAYVRAGNLYSVQGKQKAAIATFEQGCNVACDEETRAMFQERIDAAKARLKRRVDFIIQCPPEIVSNIVNYLDMDTITNACMKVSPIWHTIFLNCPSAWKSIHVLDNYHATKIPGDLLIAVSRHVKNLEVVFTSHEGWDNMLLITACTFSSLRSLSVTGHRYHQRPFANLDILYQFLENISPTLNELHIGQWSPRVSVRWILSTCRNLTSIKFSLGSASEYLAEPLFQRSPNLRYFHMDPMTNPQDGLSLVAQHCPNLAVVNTADFTKFAQLISELPVLQNLKLSYMTMTDDSVRSIAACTSLQFLSLTAMNGLTIEGRELLGQNIKQVVDHK
ncbi:hypothetical protein BJV82DRAFT_658822 [Fennellomyces sp. T-0311]|nr:hypothetical protein BJV82DRAFT_658822 [Fennellomyces sp. T-0311]